MILTVRDVRFRYNSLPVLNGVSFGVAPGESLGLLGVNGAGKSTLLRCLNRILRPECGVVMLGPRDLRRLKRSEIARLAGYVPQRHGGEHLTVFDAVLLGRLPHIRWQATTRDHRVVDEILTQLGLARLALRPVETLSGGEMQKVAIARALAQEPEVLLLDEPTSNLDLRNQLEVMELIRTAVRARRASAVVSVHDINLALRFLDRLLLLKDGVAHAVVTPEELTPEIAGEVFGVEVVRGTVGGCPVLLPVRPL